MEQPAEFLNLLKHTLKDDKKTLLAFLDIMEDYFYERFVYTCAK